MTTNLGDDPPTDDKPLSLGREKVGLSNNEKSESFQGSDNVDNSYVQDVLGTLDNSPIDDEISDSDEEKTIDTNQRDPFASLN
jgi:hypothetical protein